MYLFRILALIYLGMTLPGDSIAAALEKFKVPQSDTQSRPSDDVYSKFEEEVKSYSPNKKQAQKKYFNRQLTKARSEGNPGAVAHYERLLGILESDGK